MPAAYSLNSYLLFAMGAATPFSYPGWSQLSFLGIGFLAVIVTLVCSFRYHKALKAGFLISTAFFAIPVFGYVLNGFGYVSNRWCYGYAFCVGLITVFAVPELSKLSRKQTGILWGAVIAYGAVILGFTGKDKLIELGLNTVVTRHLLYAGIAFMAAALAAVMLIRKEKLQKAGALLLALVTVVSVVFSVYTAYSPDHQNAVDDFFDETGMMTALAGEEESVIKKIKDDSFYRTEVKANRSNRFLMTGKYGTSAYWSAMPAVIADFYQDFELDSLRQNYALWGLDNRAALCAVDSVKYVLVHASTERTLIPYGFDRVKSVKKEGSKFVFYENQYALPLGYTYDGYIDRAVYDELSPVERQQAILQGAVAGEPIEGIPEKTPEITASYIPFTITEQEGITLDDGIYRVRTGGHMTLQFDGLADSETYVYLKGLEFHGKQSTDIAVSSGEVSKKTWAYNPAAYYYFEREGISFNLGYSEEGFKECTITFEKKGNYTFEPEIICLPMADYAGDVKARREVVMENIREDGSHITGEINTPDTRFLVFSIPDLGGWKVLIDGSEVPVTHVNTMFFGVVVQPGQHDVELKYTPPGLLAGACVSIISLAGILVFSIAGKISKKKGKKR